MAAALRDTPATRTRNLRQELARVQTLEKSSHRRAATGRILGVGAEQRAANVAIAKATGDVIAVENGGEQLDVLAMGRIEARQTAAGHHLRFGELTQLLVGGSGVVDHRQGLEITAIAGQRLFLVVNQT